MSNKKLKNKEKNSDDKKSLTIIIPSELYQLLLEKTGKGSIGKYVQEAVEEKLKEEEMLLTNAYRSLEENEEYQAELTNFQKVWKDKQYEEASKKPPKLKKKNG